VQPSPARDTAANVETNEESRSHIAHTPRASKTPCDPPMTTMIDLLPPICTYPPNFVPHSPYINLQVFPALGRRSLRRQSVVLPVSASLK